MLYFMYNLQFFFLYVNLVCLYADEDLVYEIWEFFGHEYETIVSNECANNFINAKFIYKIF